MNTLKKMFVKVARSGRKLTLVGALVGAASLMASATETVEKAAPIVERLETVKLTTVKHNLEAIMAALAIVDPAWAKNLPKAKDARKVKKGGKKANGKMLTGIRGVLRFEPGVGSAPGKYYITPYAVTLLQGICTDGGTPCRIVVNLDDIDEDTEGFFIYEDQMVEELSSEGPYAEL